MEILVNLNQSSKTQMIELVAKDIKTIITPVVDMSQGKRNTENVK